MGAIPYIGPFLAFATSRIGLPIVVAGAIVFFYEGVPLGPVRDIPYVGPALSGIVDGRVDREYAAGQLNERLVWQEKQRRAEIAQAAKIKAKQADIDAAAQQLADSEGANRADTLRIADLEDRIRQQKDEDNGPPSSGDASRACKPRYGLPARLSVGVDAIGR
ncbi:MAG: hypothetical protein EOS73_25405 [Mesorhizobium sp.]|uniref:hypothetical protein n=1 Tax=Mesorhizobium sp. M7A.F.Ca.ET.027.02.1.1 TaxID=2496655 RepID=UPI000FD320CE|nr:hypothetical protein [Mesorhizobium sp. M7A.F.Ca.ET.027.02.1.1]RVD16853.1 hypothetical protein EN749_10895 [Mesorhizobium sp. M7A.F.Ca.ET.027.02.1.1]RWD00491.1 MAG: hypothetical protein EOS73_25405 [Mesorhizobium sp.]